MSVGSLIHAQAVSFNVSTAGTAETVIAVSDVVPPNVGGEGYAVLAEIGNILGNASASTCRVRIRQGTTTSGTIVADSGANTVPAAANYSTSCGGVDNSPVSQYCLTIQNSLASQSQTSTGIFAVSFASSGIN